MRAGARVRALVLERGIAKVDGEEWESLRASLPDVSESTLRKHLLALRLEIAQPWCGVDCSSMDGLETTLREMTRAYATHPHPAREQVIGAKDKARFASRNTKAAAEKRALKSEMVEWMLVWLGDPNMFPDWVGLRRAVLSSRAEVSPAKPNLL